MSNVILKLLFAIRNHLQPEMRWIGGALGWRLRLWSGRWPEELNAPRPAPLELGLEELAPLSTSCLFLTFSQWLSKDCQECIRLKDLFQRLHFFLYRRQIFSSSLQIIPWIRKRTRKKSDKVNLPRGSLKRTLWSFESAIIVKTTIFIIKAIKNVELLKFRALGLAWLRSDEANEIADKAKRKAWNDFKARYPNVDLIKFSAQVSFDDKRQATAEVY